MRTARALGLGIATAVLVGAGLARAQSDQTPGLTMTVRPSDLPAPYATPSASNPPRLVSRPPGTGLRVPPGFVANPFAENLNHPRWFEVAPNGDVFLAESDVGRITLLRDADHDGRAESVSPFIGGFREPHGMAVRPGWLYVADTEAVWRIPYQPGDTGPRGPRQRVTWPGAFGPPGGHWTRNIVFHPDGSVFYVAIGSSGNLNEDRPPRATIAEFHADGSSPRVFASGLRNAVGIAFRPNSTELWAVVNERDGLGDGLVPDYFTHVVDGGFYGWPYAYIGPNPQPGFAERRPDLVRDTLVPDLLFKAHSAPIGMVFYTGTMFPQEYQGDAFVALRGSWNSGAPTGYMIVRVPFRDGRPVGHYEIFASGFWLSGSDTARVWGRPAGLAVATDGALLIADDTGGSVWRVAWQGR